MNNTKLIQTLHQFVSTGEKKSTEDIIGFIKSAEKEDTQVERVIRSLRGLALTQDQADEIIAEVQMRVRP